MVLVPGLLRRVPISVAFVVEPSNVVEDTVISPAITVAIRDARNQTILTATNTVTLSIASGTGTLGGTLSRAAVNGVATFNDITVDTAGSFTLAAASSGLTGDASGSFTVSASGGSLPTFDNEPAGATRTRNEFTDFGNSTYRATYDEIIGSQRSGSSGQFETVSGVTDAPYTGQLDPGHAAYRKVGRLWVNAGDGVGFTSVSLRSVSTRLPASNWAKAYVGFHYRLSTPYSWQNPPDNGIGGIQKNFEIWCANDAINYEFSSQNIGTTNDPASNHQVGVVIQDSQAGMAFDGAGNFAPMEWVKFETVVERATKRVTVWANGSVMYNALRPNLDVESGFSRHEFLLLLGGVGGSAPLDCYMDVDWTIWSYTT